MGLDMFGSLRLPKPKDLKTHWKNTALNRDPFQASPSESHSLALLVVGVLGFRKSWEVKKMGPC